MKFVKGHKPWNTGLKVRLSPKSEFKKGVMVGEKHPGWKGDLVGYHGIHKWIGRKLGVPNKCENCGVTTAKKFEWANLSGEYKRDLSDWKRLCTSCHQKHDGHRYKQWKTIRQQICV